MFKSVLALCFVASSVTALTDDSVNALIAKGTCAYDFESCVNGTQSGPSIGAKFKICPVTFSRACGSPCVMSTWSTAPQTDECSIVRKRFIVTKPQNGGTLCPTQMTETTPVPPVDCVYSAWLKDGECDVNGNALFRRTVITPAKCGGSCNEPLTKIERGCPMVTCKVSDWIASECDPATNTKVMMKVVIQEPKYGPPGCPLPEPRVVPCGGIDCVMSDWGSWLLDFSSTSSAPDVRYRTILQQPMFGGQPCGPTKEYRQFGGWSKWVCDPETGIKTRQRICTDPDYVGLERTESRICDPEDCQWGEFTPWVCNPLTGIKTRTRQVKKPAKFGGKDCQGDADVDLSIEHQPCNPVDCVMSDWEVRADGIRTRKIITPPMYGGDQCGSEIEALNVDCEVSDWTEEGGCIVVPAKKSKFQAMTREVVVKPEGDGRDCPSLSRMVAC